MGPKIAIIGAGPAGCMLARLLHLGGIDAVIYEGEASPDYRSQGGTLDLHTATGLAAMHDAQLFDKFLEHARYDGEYMLVCDWKLGTLFTRGEEPTTEKSFMGQRPEIDRSALRQILTESLPEGTVRWGHHVKSIAAAKDGAPTSAVITFADGTTASGFDLIVGADGAWSKVRSALTDQKPLYSGLGMHELRIPDAAKNAPTLTERVHHGSIFSHAEGRKLTVQQLGDGSLHVTGCFRTTEKPNVPVTRPDGTRADDWTETCGYDVHDLEAVKNAMLTRKDLFADYDPRLQEAIQLAQSSKPRSLFALPVGFQWPHKEGLTLIGDAAHLMTPFAGEGVNVALDDARKLAAAILAAATQQLPDSASLDDAVCAFEQDMYARTVRVTKLTDDLLQAFFFTPGAPHSVIASTMALHVKFNSPAVVRPFVSPLMHAVYFLYTKVLHKDLKV